LILSWSGVVGQSRFHSSLVLVVVNVNWVLAPYAVDEVFFGRRRRVIRARTQFAGATHATAKLQDLELLQLLKAFAEAAHRGRLNATKQIMAVEDDDQREFKSKAFVIAARHG
jgi:hypothetical protein